MRLKYFSLVVVGLALTGVTSGCGTIIGLDEYEAVDSGSDLASGGTTSGGTTNTGGDVSSSGGTSSGGAATGGTGGSDPVTCATNCDDKNDCTADSCVDGECLNEPAEVGDPCKSGFCDEDAVCVACLDSEDGFNQDLGCNSITPTCDTTSDVPVCKGCMTGADCNNQDDCTIDKCEAHWCVPATSFLPAGSACGDAGHACNDSGKCSDCWDTSGGGIDAGCQAGAGSCDTSGAEPICTGCTKDADCDDGNECTLQTCNASHQCVLPPVPAGNGCSGGVCNGVAGNEACIACIDDDTGVDTADVDSGCESVASKPFCTVSGNGPACSPCMNTDTGVAPSDVDSGCSAGNPLCVADGGGILSCQKCVNTEADNASADVDEGCTAAQPFCLPGGGGLVCKACVNDVAGVGEDSGCSAGTPMCDTSGAVPVCRECITNTDCSGDGLSCTNEVCTSGVCSSNEDDTKCSNLDANICTKPTCDASNPGPSGCTEIDITTSVSLMDGPLGNGDFEDKVQDVNAVGWTEYGPYWLVYDCSGLGCATPAGDTKTIAPGPGNAHFAWLGHYDASENGDLYATIALPVGAQSISIVADINFQTQSKNTGNTDSLSVFLENTNKTHIGSALKTWSTASPEMQLSPTRAWTANGMSIQNADVSAYGGTSKIISFETISVDAPGVNNDKTGWLMDNLRITAKVCK